MDSDPGALPFHGPAGQAAGSLHARQQPEEGLAGQSTELIEVPLNLPLYLREGVRRAPI